MAEVKQLYSAVGAYEAQVFNFDKAYNALQRQADMQRRMQAQTNDEVDRMMRATFAQRGGTRAQDRDGIAKEYDNLTKFYTDNVREIKNGYGEKYSKFMEMMGGLRSNIAYSTALNEKEKRILPVLKTKDGQTELLPDQITHWNQFTSSIYNPDGTLNNTRKAFTFKKKTAAGEQVYSIDNLDIDDVTPIQVFNEVNMNKTIADFAKPFKISKDIISGDKKTTYSAEVKDPVQIAGQTTAYLGTYRKADEWYKKRFESESPDAIQKANEEMNAFVELFKENGKALVWDSDKDNKISNHLEYAIYRQIKMNLPKDLGEKIDFSPAQNQRAWQTLAQRKKEFNWRQFTWGKEYEERNPISIDEAFSNAVVNGDSDDNWKKNVDALNNFYGSKSLAATGSGEAPNRIQYWSASMLKDANNAKTFEMLVSRQDPKGQGRGNIKAGDIQQGAITFETFVPIYDKDNNMVRVDANGRVPNYEGGVTKDKAGNPVAYNVVKGVDGFAYNRIVTVVPIDKNQDPNTVRTKFSMAFSMANDVLTGENVIKAAQNLTQGGKGVKMEVQGKQVGGTKTKTSRSSGTSNSGSTSNKK